MDIKLRPFYIHDYDKVIQLWSDAEHVVLRLSDSRDSIKLYLDRNPELSCVATLGDEIIGAALLGHDRRCGYLHHLVVSKPYRRRGVGRIIARACMQNLKKLGMSRCHIFVLPDNVTAIAFWEEMGFVFRSNVSLMTFDSDATSS